MLAAAGIAFFVILSFVPAMAAFVALYGLAFNTGDVVAQFESISYLMPADASTLLRDQLVQLTTTPDKELGIAAAIAFAIAIFSASSATKGIIEGLNIVYDEHEKRSWWFLSVAAMILTVAGLVSIIAFLVGSVFLPKILEWAGVHSAVLPVALSYAFLAAFLLVELAAVYRWAPSRSEARFVWIAPGSLLAVALLLAFSASFAWFVRTFAAYDAYGSLSVVVATMTWLWVSLVIVLLGAQINAEAEHQTAKDSTTGAPLPLGARGAVMADTVGEPAELPVKRQAARTPQAEIALVIALSLAAAGLLWWQFSDRR
jgi:membrane protein